MKKTIRIVGGVLCTFFSVVANAQTWEAKNNATVDSITAKYKDKVVTLKPAPTLQDVFPVIGIYQAADAPTLTITLDETNKGIVWIDGLPQGKAKAMLRMSPATYKVPLQKTADGKEVKEGTLIFDKETNTVSICLGKAYDVGNPASAFETTTEAVPTAEVKVKTKKTITPKAWIYVGTKQHTETALQ